MSIKDSAQNAHRNLLNETEADCKMKLDTMS